MWVLELRTITILPPVKVAVRALRAAVTLHRVATHRSRALLGSARHVSPSALTLLTPVGKVREALSFSYHPAAIQTVPTHGTARTLHRVGTAHRRALRSPAGHRTSVALAFTAGILWVGERLPEAVLPALVHAAAAVLAAVALHRVFARRRLAHLPHALDCAVEAPALLAPVARVVENLPVGGRLAVEKTGAAFRAALHHGRVGTVDRGT